MSAPQSAMPFEHRHAGHCETGVTAGLLRHAGLSISEPMALGLGHGLTFAHFPFFKVGGLPLTSYRMPPGSIYRTLAKRLGFRLRRQRFGDAAAGARALDAHLAAGRPVGVQASVFWLPYFPTNMRFHFNAHNLIVYGRDGGDYLLSDPVFEHPQRCPAADLAKARFAKGALAPKGLLYFPENVPREVDHARLVPYALRKTARMMLHTPMIVGISAMLRLARTIERMGSRADPRYVRLFVGQIVRMQEEIGTGGGGFRFMYAAFLQEASERLDEPRLAEASRGFTAIGDAWRAFALAGARYVKDKSQRDTAPLAAALRHCAALEQSAYRELLEIARALDARRKAA
ncbi:MAG TPA: BtrH N-terminal domain-containing protein [Candidatus Binatia bacterium]|nr:BtrH N-terminal domain-containing protein [Candidatus Binatia bacterium]